MSRESFKEFIRTKPELASYIETGQMTWQKFYELYDIYGENDDIWQKYSSRSPRQGIKKVSDMFEKFDPDTLQKHIENAQKALDVFSELATKTTENVNNIKPVIEKPISKFFGD